MNAPNQSFPWKPIAALLFLQAGLFGMALGGVMLLGHLQCRENSQPSTSASTTVLQYPRTARFEDSKQEHDPRLLPVNERARSEVKQGRWIYNPNTGEHVWCNDCGQVVTTPSQPAPIVRPQPSRPTPAPTLPSPAALLPTDKPVNQPVQQQIMLFLLPGDPLSAKLEQWFDTNPTLLAWRKTGTFHKFTPDNKMYQTLVNRGVSLREQVPVSAFPAALFTAADGGHIHAAIRNFIPSTPEELIADVGRGKANWKQMRESIPGNVAMGQYNFDDAINPKTKLSESDCTGPNCPLPRQPAVDQPHRRPGVRIVDLFPNAHDKAEGVVKDAMWGWLDILVTGVIVLSIVAAMIVLFFVGAFLVAYLVRARRIQ